MADVQSQMATDGRTRSNSLASLRMLLKRIRIGSAAKQKKRSSAIEGVRQEIILRTSEPREKTSQFSTCDSVCSEPEPTVQKALVVARKGEYEIRHDFPVPALGDNEVMISSRFVGLNPIDWKSVDYNFCLPDFPWVSRRQLAPAFTPLRSLLTVFVKVTGREMSGIVEKVGKHVKDIKPGDRVWTSTYYRDVRAGCFQEYVIVPPHTVVKIPERVPFAAAACLGVAALTACMTLWKWLGVPTPSQRNGTTGKANGDDDWLLIWGGSTVTGQFATQVASQSGLKVITVNSVETEALSKLLGASYVVTRDGKTDAEILEEITTATNGGHITRAIDLVGSKTAVLVLDAVSKERPVDFAPLAFMASTQTIRENVTVHTVEMKRFVLDESSKHYADELNNLLERDALVLPEVHLLEGGFEDIKDGLELLKQGNMKGKKLIVRI